MKSALIGHSGFVGANLADQHDFDCHYNSKNYRNMAGGRFDLVVCCGVSAVKWLANKEPEADLAALARLQVVLESVVVEQFVLISTIDVYPVLSDVDELFDCHQQKNHPYGTHRLMFEDFCRATFANCAVIRLPGLFGKGLKKNVIFDLLNDNCLDAINPESSFQYYNLQRLWKDICLVLDNSLPVVNLFSEPVRTRDMIARFCPGKAVGDCSSARQNYNLKTRYGHLWGNNRGYVSSEPEILAEILEFMHGYHGRNGQ